MSTLSFTTFLPGEAAGIAAVAVFSIISAISVIFFLFRVLWVSLYPLLNPRAEKRPSKESVFFHTQLGFYAANLLLGNLLLSLAGTVNVSWAMQNGITENVSCTSQAVLTQAGNFLNAYFLVTIAVHTVTSLIFGKRLPVMVSGLVIVIGWTLALLIAIVPVRTLVPGLGPFYGNAGYWCWITESYPSARFFLHYIFIFLAGIIAAILYSVIFLSLRGTLHLRNGFSFSLDPEKRWNGRVGTTDEYRRFIHSIARSMLWYPVGYIICLTPITASMVLEMTQFKVPFGFWVFSSIFSVMQGVINVLILYNTIRVLQPAFITLSTSQRSLDVESGGSFGEKGLISKRQSRVPDYRRRSGQGIAPYLAAQSAGELSPWGMPPVQQPKMSHQRSFSTASSSTNGAGNPFANAHARNASYDTTRSTSTVGRSITPSSQFDRPILEFPQDVVEKANPITQPRLRLVTEQHQRQGSADSLSLPPAPRRGRSPIQRHPSVQESVSASSSPSTASLSEVDRPESLYSMYQHRTPFDKDRFSAAPLPALPPLPAAVMRKPSALRGNALSPIESSEASEYSAESAGISPNIFGQFNPNTARPPTQYAEYSTSTADDTGATHKPPVSAFGSYQSSHGHLHGHSRQSSSGGNAF